MARPCQTARYRSNPEFGPLWGVAMKRYLKLLFLLPIGVAIIALAIVNRASVRLIYWPEQLGGEQGLTRSEERRVGKECW